MPVERSVSDWVVPLNFNGKLMLLKLTAAFMNRRCVIIEFHSPCTTSNTSSSFETESLVKLVDGTLALVRKRFGFL